MICASQVLLDALSCDEGGTSQTAETCPPSEIIVSIAFSTFTRGVIVTIKYREQASDWFGIGNRFSKLETSCNHQKTENDQNESLRGENNPVLLGLILLFAPVTFRFLDCFCLTGLPPSLKNVAARCEPQAFLQRIVIAAI